MAFSGFLDVQLSAYKRSPMVPVLKGKAMLMVSNAIAKLC